MNTQWGSLAQPPNGRTRSALGPTAPRRGLEPRFVPASLSRQVSYPLVRTMPQLGALPTAPGLARAFARTTLAEWQMTAFGEVAELLTSELVTNAVEASTDEHGDPLYKNGHIALVVFRMLASREGLVLEAWDMMPAAPVVQHAGTDDEHGRGMLLVQTLASRWSWRVVPGWPGKCVWAEIAP